MLSAFIIIYNLYNPINIATPLLLLHFMEVEREGKKFKSQS